MLDEFGFDALMMQMLDEAAAKLDAKFEYCGQCDDCLGTERGVGSCQDDGES